jgi:hypothetical protein
MFGLFKKKHKVNDNQILIEFDPETNRILVIFALVDDKQAKKVLTKAYAALGGKVRKPIKKNKRK